MLALAHAWQGDYDQTLVHCDRATRLNPRDPAQPWWIFARVIAAFVARRYEDVIEWANRITQTAPDHPIGWRFLTIGYVELDRTEDARAALNRYLQLVPHETIERVRATASPPRVEDRERMIDALRKAGLPE